MLKKLWLLFALDFKDWPRDIFINGVAGWWTTPRLFRFLIYRVYGLTIATRNILGGAIFKTNQASIGKGTFINYRCFFDNVAPVTIGQRCQVGMDVLFCTTGHHLGDSTQRGGPVYSKPIQVGDGCWIGARATILPGVTIGNGCIIAGGAVVAHDCEPDGVYAGVPARRVKDLP